MEIRRSKTYLPLYNTIIIMAFIFVLGTDTGVFAQVVNSTPSTSMAVPNSPNLTGVVCGDLYAIINWLPTESNGSPITRYTIEVNKDGLKENGWSPELAKINPTENSFNRSLIPWYNYTFRVIAHNTFGQSKPSNASNVCHTPAAVPFYNPHNVAVNGTTPTNLVITWNILEEIYHYGYNFRYEVQWKPINETDGNWTTVEIKDWKQNQLVIEGQPACHPYLAIVRSVNAIGKSKLTPDATIGYSGLDIPSSAPGNVTLREISSRSTRVSWESVKHVSLCQRFEGYKVHVWTDVDKNDHRREILVKSDVTTTFIDKLVSSSKYYACVLAYNGDYDGPPSQVIEIDTLEDPPGPIESFDAHPLGTNSIFLIWERPDVPNLTGYQITYDEVNGTQLGSTGKAISDPNIVKTKIRGLQSGTTYRIHIRATNQGGSGDDVFVERGTFTDPATKLVKPKFKWLQKRSANESMSIKIDWLPVLEGGSDEQPGSHFYVQYRICANPVFKDTAPELNEVYTTVCNLVADQLYVFRVVSVDGNLTKTSDPGDVITGQISELANIDYGGLNISDPCVVYRCEETKVVVEESKYSECLDKLQDTLDRSNQTAINSESFQVLEKLETITSNNQNTNNGTYYGKDILTIAGLTKKATLKKEANTTSNKRDKITEKGFGVLGNLFTNQGKWTEVKETKRPDTFTKLLDIVESTALKVADRNVKQTNFNKTFRSNETNIALANAFTLELGSRNTTKGMEQKINVSDRAYGSESFIAVTLPKQYLSHKKINYVVTMISPTFVTNITNNTIKSRGKDKEFIYDKSKQMNGKLIAFKMNQEKVKDLKVNIKVSHTVDAIYHKKYTFKRKLHAGESPKAVRGSSVCAFWDTKDKIWSSFGCSNIASDQTSTSCECDHLTAFSVLARFHKYSERDWGLEILTWILCPLSILCLMLCITAFVFEKKGRNEGKQITTHLCFTLILGNVFLLVGDKNNLHLSDNTCTSLGVITHYVWLCAFGWMAVEGIHLYLKVVKVFAFDYLLKTYCGIAYGTPVVVVATTFLIGFFLEDESTNIYVGEMYCWLKGKYIWGFMAPVLLVVVGNICILTVAIYVTANRQKTSTAIGAANTQKNSNRKLIKGAIQLTCILGVTWIFGVFTLVDWNFPGQIVFSYIFTILNASQGIFIFIFRCCLNEQIKKRINQLFSEVMTTSSAAASSKSTDNSEVKYKLWTVNKVAGVRRVPRAANDVQIIYTVHSVPTDSDVEFLTSK